MYTVNSIPCRLTCLGSQDCQVEWQNRSIPFIISRYRAYLCYIKIMTAAKVLFHTNYQVSIYFFTLQ
jgi:hypothetical protein